MFARKPASMTFAVPRADAFHPTDPVWNPRPPVATCSLPAGYAPASVTMISASTDAGIAIHSDIKSSAAKKLDIHAAANARAPRQKGFAVIPHVLILVSLPSIRFLIGTTECHALESTISRPECSRSLPQILAKKSPQSALGFSPAAKMVLIASTSATPSTPPANPRPDCGWHKTALPIRRAVSRSRCSTSWPMPTAR